MFITLVALWLIRIPAAWLLSRHMGVIGIWWSVPMGMFTGFTLSLLYYLTGRYKNKVIVRRTMREEIGGTEGT
jgi:Na+-driven multidrug efflux pump